MLSRRRESPFALPFCPYCKSLIATMESVVLCIACSALHHEDCWNENGWRCSVFGCSCTETYVPRLPQRRISRCARLLVISFFLLVCCAGLFQMRNFLTVPWYVIALLLLGGARLNSVHGGRMPDRPLQRATARNENFSHRHLNQRMQRMHFGG